MEETKKIRKALVSVYHKDGLEYILRLLAADGVTLVSTGGTRSFIESLGYECEAVEDLTGYPSILGGRVKTLHPKVFGGILSRRDIEADCNQLAEYAIPEIDMVIVDLYPFEATVASGASAQEIIEKIDIGGISLIRAAAKNFADVVIVASQAQYAPMLSILKENGAATTLEQRRTFAAMAFAVSSGYDAAIASWFVGKPLEDGMQSANLRKQLRYGENPHQQAWFIGNLDEVFAQLHGKELSYNNLLDVDAAMTLMADFPRSEGITVAILKHNNPCGLSTGATVAEAWEAALACDPVSAFGGIIISNAPVDKAAAELITKIFFEVIIAPDYTDEALEVLRSRKNRIILRVKEQKHPEYRMRSVLNGMLMQQSDSSVEKSDNFTVTGIHKPTDTQLRDMELAMKLVKHLRSNAIVLVKDGKMIGAGMGQVSRVDALKLAIERARNFGFDIKGAIMGSDAFFPFADCVNIAYEAGCAGAVHPGGSIRDAETVDFCNEHGMVIATTGIRHFRH